MNTLEYPLRVGSFIVISGMDRRYLAREEKGGVHPREREYEVMRKVAERKSLTDELKQIYGLIDSFAREEKRMTAEWLVEEPIRRKAITDREVALGELRRSFQVMALNPLMANQYEVKRKIGDRITVEAYEIRSCWVTYRTLADQPAKLAAKRKVLTNRAAELSRRLVSL